MLNPIPFESKISEVELTDDFLVLIFKTSTALSILLENPIFIGMEIAINAAPTKYIVFEVFFIFPFESIGLSVSPL